MPRHQSRPVIVNEDYCRIGQPPLADKTALPLNRSYRYLNNFHQSGNLFTYSTGIDDTYGDDIGSTENGSFIVIFGGWNKADSGNRSLEGRLIPWFYEPTASVQDVLVTWQQRAGSLQTLYTSQNSMQSGDKVSRRGFLLKSKWTTSGAELFEYTPAAAGLWDYGTLVTKGIHTASLGIWAAPDVWLSSAQAIVDNERLMTGEVIRGINSTSGKESIGDLLERVGKDSVAADALLHNATRCVWQWGHPAGVYTDVNSYQQMGDTGVFYKLYVPDLYHTSTIALYPTVYLTTSGASGGDPAYFRLTAEDLGGGADTWTLTLTSDTSDLYDYTDASSDTLLCRAGSPTEFKIELMAPSSGYIVMHTLAIWARLWT
jgi:hypothetical protein